MTAATAVTQQPLLGFGGPSSRGQRYGASFVGDEVLSAWKLINASQSDDEDLYSYDSEEANITADSVSDDDREPVSTEDDDDETDVDVDDDAPTPRDFVSASDVLAIQAMSVSPPMTHPVEMTINYVVCDYAEEYCDVDGVDTYDFDDELEPKRVILINKSTDAGGGNDKKRKQDHVIDRDDDPKQKTKKRNQEMESSNSKTQSPKSVLTGRQRMERRKTKAAGRRLCVGNSDHDDKDGLDTTVRVFHGSPTNQFTEMEGKGWPRGGAAETAGGSANFGQFERKRAMKKRLALIKMMRGWMATTPAPISKLATNRQQRHREGKKAMRFEAGHQRESAMAGSRAQRRCYREERKIGQ
ncbi:hypothetical protein SASPL_101762 [Salvia splendens]|uniref:Uncharacterized protein n=1 Tax=Salvia splendens TaxID=180675 RepID=A0A8X9ACT0_SALSN|nr:hypothetical protein SASPL_101762 [Salvia splendens]